MIAAECERILTGLGIDVFFETGTDKGETVAEVSRWFSKRDSAFGRVTGEIATGARSYNWWNEPIRFPTFVDAVPHRFQVHSVDLDAHSCTQAARVFRDNCNIHLHHGSSPEVLATFVAGIGADDPGRCLFYLDAHWGKYWPLRDEIRQVVRLPRFAIVIDDFWVPGRSSRAAPHGLFGYDVYEGRALDWSYIHDLFSPNDVRVFYPSNPNRDRRGWVLILAGYGNDELTFLDDLGLKAADPAAPSHTRQNTLSLMGRLDWRNILKRCVPASVLRHVFRRMEALARIPAGLSSSPH